MSSAKGSPEVAGAQKAMGFVPSVQSLALVASCKGDVLVKDIPLTKANATTAKIKSPETNKDRIRRDSVLTRNVMPIKRDFSSFLTREILKVYVGCRQNETSLHGRCIFPNIWPIYC